MDGSGRQYLSSSAGFHKKSRVRFWAKNAEMLPKGYQKFTTFVMYYD